MPVLHQAVQFISRQEWLDGFSESLQTAIGDAFDRGGEAGQWAKNALSGTWLGHPLHPVLTDLPIGFWTSSVVLDALDTLGIRSARGGADITLAAGTLSAVDTGLAGLSDWQHTHDRARRIGLVHGLMNIGATMMFAPAADAGAALEGAGRLADDVRGAAVLGLPRRVAGVQGAAGGEPRQ